MRGLEALARAYGIQTRYHDVAGSEREASAATIRAVLGALGVAVEDESDIEDALWRREQELHLRIVEPVTVCWEGTAPAVEIRPARAESGQRIACRLDVEGGGTLEWTAGGPRIELPPDLPLGIHDLVVEIGERRARTRVLHAPPAAWDPERRDWGVFLPLYALRSGRAWGTGDLTDLAALLDWTRSLGGRFVATLPLLAAFLDAPFDPSPYAPVSRLFWNELYADPTAAPELAGSAEAREILGSREVQRKIRRLRRAPLVDYRESAALKRRVLDELARAFFAGDGPRSEPFRAFLEANGEARAYARFRATCEREERGWRDWPARMRDGRLETGDYDPESARTHLYAQWLLARQLGRLEGLYLDLPLGVHPDGFDAWRFRDAFADGVSAGAPPDDFFAGGQDWGFRPLHPQRIRATGYRYLADSLAAVCRHADVLRLDHVMGLHRLWWVPHGMPATDGVYVRYRSEEMWAVACLQSRRHATAIVGEDLGTVPPETREAIERHAARRMYVVPFELAHDPPRLAPVPAHAAASWGTHDMPPFAGWWAEAAPAWREALAAALERAGALEPFRPGELPTSERSRPVLEAALRYLSDSPARLVAVNLEDLWLEEEPQNRPGTTMAERPNWRRKARFAIETFREMPEVVDTLRESVAHRREGVPEGDPTRRHRG